MLAAAGLARLGRSDAITETFGPGVMLPAPAQGALAVECRAGEARLVHRRSRAARRLARPGPAAVAERGVLAGLEAGLLGPGGRLGSWSDGC